MKLGRFELSLNVADLEASRKFYESVGFRVLTEDAKSGWAVIRNDAVTIGLYQGHVPANLLNFRGQDVFETAAELEKRGVTLYKAAEVESDGSAGAWIKDPDGNLIYLNTAPGETEACLDSR